MGASVDTNLVRTFCLSCGYGLDNLESSVCPECGGEFDASNPETFATSAGTAHWLRWQQRALLLAGLLVPLEFFFALLSHETVGEDCKYALFFLAIVGNLLACALLVMRLPRISVACQVVVGLMIIPYQLALGIQYITR